MKAILNKDEKADYFPALTGVRAIAAFMVFLHHFNPFRDSNPGTAAYYFVNELDVGVTFFFVLSGFLIAYKYFEIRQDGLKVYLVKRLARIYPMFFILTTASFIIGFVHAHSISQMDITIYFYNITFLKGFFNDLKYSGIAQGWTLTVEELFYLLAPLIFLLIRKKYFNLLFLPLLFTLVGIVLVMYCKDVLPFGFFDSYAFMFNYTFFGRAFEFFVGIVLAIVIKGNLLHMNFKWMTFIGLMLTLAFIIATVVFNNYNPGFKSQLIFKVICYTYLMPIFGISLFYLGLIRERTLISGLLESRLMLLLGKSSYVFYLIHLGELSTFIYKFTDSYMVIFILINIVSIVLYKYVEQPLNVRLKKIAFTRSR